MPSSRISIEDARRAYVMRTDERLGWAHINTRLGRTPNRTTSLREAVVAYAETYDLPTDVLRLRGPRPGGPVADTFGIEIEVNALDPQTAFRALQALNLFPVVYRRYGDHCHGGHHDAPGTWIVTTDCTVSGCEVVTPDGGLTYNDESFEIIRQVMQTLKDHGAHVRFGGPGQSPGTHTHIGTRGMTRAQVVAFGMAYVERQEAINSLLAPRRRNDSGMCGTMTPEQFRRYAQPLARGGRCHERYVAVNLVAYSKHSTVEFRQHQGTLNPLKIRAWVDMLFALRAAVLDGSIANVGRYDVRFLDDLARIGHLSDTAATYLAGRAARLAA